LLRYYVFYGDNGKSLTAKFAKNHGEDRKEVLLLSSAISAAFLSDLCG